ncbi:hypothetical protein BGZ83_006606 [Gryganskiella cystojenkinii]|nr:hypothetical protein BGZ83_006606 [Gryganskiella cystojenkinii]
MPHTALSKTCSIAFGSAFRPGDRRQGCHWHAQQPGNKPRNDEIDQIRFLKKFDFTPVHIRGNDNAIADALSRYQRLGEPEDQEGEDEELNDDLIGMTVSRVNVSLSGLTRTSITLSKRVEQADEKTAEVRSEYYKILKYLSVRATWELTLRRRCLWQKPAAHYVLGGNGLLFFKTRSEPPLRGHRWFG